MKKQSAQSYERITKKELYSRLVSLDTKVDVISKDGKETRKRFTNYVFIMVLLHVVNFLVSVLTLMKVSQ